MPIKQAPHGPAWSAESRRRPRAFVQEDIDFHTRIVDVSTVFLHPRVREEDVSETDVLTGQVADVDGFRVETLGP